MKIQGAVIKFGDNVNTDVIIPSKYLVYTDPHDLAAHAMEGLDPNFPQKVLRQPILVAGKNFGCGSSREQAPIALKYAGVKCVLADSYARIFYRNAINVGLPILECDNISRQVQDGDELTIDVGVGVISNVTRSQQYIAIPVPPFLIEIMAKGLVEYVKAKRR